MVLRKIHGEFFTSTRDIRWVPLSVYTDAMADYISNNFQVENPPVLVGHSMGGFVIQKYLEQEGNNDKVAGAVLMASVPPTGGSRSFLNQFLKTPLIALQIQLTLSFNAVIATPERARQFFFSESMPEEEVVEYWMQMHDESYRAYVDTTFLLPRVRNIQSPILVLGAQNDNTFAEVDYTITAKAYNTEAIVFPNMAHDMMLEAGWQDVASTIVDWVRNNYTNTNSSNV
mmetsp:Transcript_11584/g.17687  ORF Transcript_11584/g.17687 Transcript_11584/m.17687 type:complete len:229 (+) Transcript_11584:67-753(+)